MKKPIVPIVYSDISFKKQVPKTSEKLSFEEAFIRALDLIDFYVAISDPKVDNPKDDNIEWIELTWCKNDH